MIKSAGIEESSSIVAYIDSESGTNFKTLTDNGRRGNGIPRNDEEAKSRRAADPELHALTISPYWAQRGSPPGWNSR